MSRPSERRAFPEEVDITPPEDLVDAMLILHGAKARLVPVAFHRIQRGDRLLLGPLANELTGAGPCQDVAVTAGDRGYLTTEGGITMKVTGTGGAEPVLWVVEVPA